MTLAIHQPNHLPWLGYWLKLAAADLFLFYDDCPINQSGVTRRVSVAPRNGETDRRHWSTLPLSGCAHGTPINRVRMSLGNRARAGVLQRLQASYGPLPHYRAAIAPFETELKAAAADDLLAEFNIAVLRSYLELLQIDTQTRRTSELLPYVPGPKHLAALTAAAGANQYLSGSGGAKRYFNGDEFADLNADCRFVDFTELGRHHFLHLPDIGHTFIGILSKIGVEAFRQNLLSARQSLAVN